MHISKAGICSLTHGMRQFSSNSPLHHMKLSRHLVLLAGAIPAAALPWDGPTATPSSGGSLGRTQDDAPVETDAPPRELIRRDDLSLQLCGWLWGVTPLTPCSPFSTCYFRTDISVVGCCRDTLTSIPALCTRVASIPRTLRPAPLLARPTLLSYNGKQAN